MERGRKCIQMVACPIALGGGSGIGVLLTTQWYCLCSNKHRNGLSMASCNAEEGEGRVVLVVPPDHRDKLLSWAAFPVDSLLWSHGHLFVSQATFKGHGTMCVNSDLLPKARNEQPGEL